jgi:RNA polymerase sigma-70 factor (ECF subfamily)
MLLSLNKLMQCECTAHRKHTGRDIIRLFGKKDAEQEIRDGLPIIFPRLWRYALVLTSNRDAAFDLAQATCLRALEQSDKYEPGTNLDRWLFRMAHRIWLNELRALAVRRGGGLQAVADVEIPDPKLDAETNYFIREVLHSIYSLPEAQRACVILVYVEGFKYAEAADILAVPIGTVMSRLSAARKTVSGRLGNKGEKLG